MTGIQGSIRSNLAFSQETLEISEQPVAEAFHMISVALQIGFGHFCRFSQTHNVGSVFGTAAPSKFLSPANQQDAVADFGFRLESTSMFVQASRSNVQCSNSLGCPNFVANDSYHVGISHIFQMNRNFSGRLRSIRVTQDTPFPAFFCNFLDGLQCPRFVVGQHKGYQNGIGSHGLDNIRCRNPALCVHRNPCDANTTVVCFHVPQIVFNGGVLDVARDNVFGPVTRHQELVRRCPL
mmetsp:Transcript_3746/g.8961  ORF Transcript_3746/g.8961 Transcript_3746/m.8961 type:complete len:237 (-) Transcript_3746:505-1215(-)